MSDRESYPDRETWMLSQLLKQVTRSITLGRLLTACPDPDLRSAIAQRFRADVSEGFCPKHRTALVRDPERQNAVCPECGLAFRLGRQESISHAG